MPARDASTGEQKALLIGLVLAHATLVAEMTGIVPLLLLDEVVAHLDPDRRNALFDELAKLGAQVWMTGADPAAFAEIGAAGEVFDVEFRPDQPARLTERVTRKGERAGPAGLCLAAFRGPPQIVRGCKTSCSRPERSRRIGLFTALQIGPRTA